MKNHESNYAKAQHNQIAYTVPEWKNKENRK